MHVLHDPSIRGLMRSKPIDRILAEARELAADGAVELNLIGQDTTSFGSDIGYAPGLSGLLSALDRELKDVHWLRLMYAYPSCFTDEMIRTIADRERVVKYIDMPLQHINDELLTKMRRRVTRMQIETLLDKLRRWVPGIAIRTTFIAGSPGETDQQHAELVRFVKEFGFDMMGVFPYSQEPGTPMGRMEGQLPDEVKQQRVEELMLAQQEVAFAKAKQMKGQTIELLIERPAGRDAEDARSASSGQGWVARSQGQAPDIDSVTFLHPGPARQCIRVSSSPRRLPTGKATTWWRNCRRRSPGGWRCWGRSNSPRRDENWSGSALLERRLPSASRRQRRWGIGRQRRLVAKRLAMSATILGSHIAPLCGSLNHGVATHQGVRPGSDAFCGPTGRSPRRTYDTTG